LQKRSRRRTWGKLKVKRRPVGECILLGIHIHTDAYTYAHMHVQIENMMPPAAHRMGSGSKKMAIK